MTNDTIKSMGYLKKSLKMSRRAVEKNQTNDNTTDQNVKDFQTKIDDLLVEIEKWEAFALISSSVPSTSIPSVTTTVTPTSNDGGTTNNNANDLLVDP